MFKNKKYPKYLAWILLLFVCYLVFILSMIVIWRNIRSKLRTLLLMSLPVFNNNNIDYWVDFGTLLGIHRDQDIIFGDTDCDVCIWKKDKDKIKPILQEYAKQNKILRFEELWWGAFRFHYGFTYIDIYMAQENPDDPSMIQIPDSRDTPKYLLTEFEVVNVPFYDTTITIRQPVRWKELLEFRYKNDWFICAHKWWLGYIPISKIAPVYSYFKGD